MSSNSTKYSTEMRERTARYVIESGKSATFHKKNEKNAIRDGRMQLKDL